MPRPEHAGGRTHEEGVEGVDVVLAVPRLLLSVPRLVLMAAFFPVQKGLRAAERNAVPQHIVDVLYNDERNAAIVPAASYQSNFGFSYGANVFHEDLLGHGEQGDIKLRFGGVYAQAYDVAFEAERLAGTRYWLRSQLRYEVNPRLLFEGIGPVAAEPRSEPPVGPRESSMETRFSQSRVLGLLGGGYTLGRPGALIKVGGTAIFNRRRFAEEKGTGEDVSIEEIYDTGRLIGFDDGVDQLELDAVLVLDARDYAGQTARGVYFEIFGGGVAGPWKNDRRFWHYGAETTVFINLYRQTRILVLRAAMEAVHGDKDAIPFTELPRLGGPHRLRGYSLDRFRDRRSALGTVEYRYPIHGLVSGAVFFDVGHVGSDYRQLFDDPSDWRTGVGGGVIVSTLEDMKLRIEVAHGEATEVFVTTDPLQAFVSRSDKL